MLQLLWSRLPLHLPADTVDVEVVDTVVVVVVPVVVVVVVGHVLHFTGQTFRIICATESSPKHACADWIIG